MKKLKYIYLLLIAMLLGFAISSCEDDEVVVGEDDEEEIVGGGSGEMISTTFTVGISAPNVSGDLDVATRAGGDNANIEYAKPENGGRFQNLIVVLTNQEGIIKGVECKNWGDGVGVKEYTAIFPNIQVPATDVTNKKQYKVYAFGNICQKHYVELDDEAKSKINGSYTGWQNFDKHCISLTLKADNVYELDFTPGTTHYSRKNNKEYYVNTNSPTQGGKEPVVCTGMPVNNSATATVVKGNTQFNVALKRVCARLQVTFRNFTGTYKNYDKNGDETPNNVYVDKFEIKNVLSNKANYFCNNTTSVTDAISSNFDILQALGGSKTNDHIINKIENGKDLVVSMYVFENNKGGYQYDLKVDRGKSLGKDTKTLQADNAYVIWNQQKEKALGYDTNTNELKGSYQTQLDKINFSDQVFWTLVPGSVADVYALKHYPINLNTDSYDSSLDNNGGNDVYLKKQSTGGTSKLGLSPAGNNDGDRQYVYFQNTGNNQYGVRFCASSSDNNHRFGIGNYHLLTVDDKGYLENKKETLSSKVHADWTLYAKYIIKNGQPLKQQKINGESDEKNITKIERNHSYELDFSVMPNYETKQELVVSCVRKQNEVNWSEVEK